MPRKFHHKKRSKGKGWEPRTDKIGRIDPAVIDNPLFTEYYQAQAVMPAEEWDAFIACMRQPLPITFRINGTGRFAAELRTKLEKDYLSHLQSTPMEVEGETIQPPHKLEWYPESLAWQIDCSKAQLRRLPTLSSLFEAIKELNLTGAITRQEAVSMVPPLLLDVQPHHMVLDTCAAPGSKTIQLIEQLHAGTPGGIPGVPPGLVVANDVDAQRCSLLVHQTKRMVSPNLLVLNHPAQFLPVVRDEAGHPMLFDRILCDVPCSGDGTLRKTPDIWVKWTPKNANGLHALQVLITTHACRLLRQGGRLVYSTCSLNPIEDEAVVAEILRRSNGSMELLDMSAMLPELKRAAGQTTWRVHDGQGWVDSPAGNRKLPSSLWPPSQAELASMPLERCMRLLPHQNNAGGFFVAVLEKRGRFPMEPVAKPPVASKEGEAAAGEAAGEAADTNASVGGTKSDGVNTADATNAADANDDEPMAAITPSGKEASSSGRRHGIDPIHFLPDNSPLIASIVDYFGIMSTFPLEGLTMTRSADGEPRRIHYLAPASKQLLVNDQNQMLRAPVVGLKMFDRHSKMSGPLTYRIVYDGLQLLLPHMRKQVARIPIDDFLLLTEKRALRLRAPVEGGPTTTAEEAPAVEGPEGGSAEEQGAPPKKPKMDVAVMPVHLEAMQAAMQDIEVGCCVVLIADDDCRRYGLDVIQQDGVTNLMGASLYACLAWKGKASLTIQVPKADCQQLAHELRGVLGLPVPQRAATKTYRLPPGTSSLSMLHQLGTEAAEEGEQREAAEEGEQREAAEEGEQQEEPEACAV